MSQMIILRWLFYPRLPFWSGSFCKVVCT